MSACAAQAVVASSNTVDVMSRLQGPLLATFKGSDLHLARKQLSRQFVERSFCELDLLDDTAAGLLRSFQEDRSSCRSSAEVTPQFCFRSPITSSMVLITRSSHRRDHGSMCGHVTGPCI